jgi:hypothetical protein
VWNHTDINGYKDMTRAMREREGERERERGLTPIVTLNHLTLPLLVLTHPIEFTKKLGQD